MKHEFSHHTEADFDRKTMKCKECSVEVPIRGWIRVTVDGETGDVPDYLTAHTDIMVKAASSP